MGMIAHFSKRTLDLQTDKTLSICVNWTLKNLQRWWQNTDKLISLPLVHARRVIRQNYVAHIITASLLASAIMYIISLKSCRTSKSCHPQNFTACFCELIPINTALKISPHGKGSPAIYICVLALYVHTYKLINVIIEYVHVDLCRRRPRINYCCRTKLGLEIKSCRSRISRKYGNPYYSRLFLTVFTHRSYTSQLQNCHGSNNYKISTTCSFGTQCWD